MLQATNEKSIFSPHTIRTKKKFYIKPQMFIAWTCPYHFFFTQPRQAPPRNLRSTEGNFWTLLCWTNDPFEDDLPWVFTLRWTIELTMVSTHPWKTTRMNQTIRRHQGFIASEKVLNPRYTDDIYVCVYIYMYRENETHQYTYIYIYI